MYKTKFSSNGIINRYKSRLIAQGFTKTLDVDYKDTFALVTKMNTICALLSMAINCGWSMSQMDVKNAFLHGDIKEDVYKKLPLGHPQSSNYFMVCKLHKSINGFKQPPRVWHAKLSSPLEDLGFLRIVIDFSLFVRHVSNETLVVLVYVDVLIIAGNSNHVISQL